MRAIEFINESDDEPTRIKIGGGNNAAKAWIEKVYTRYPQTFQNNHVMPMGGEGDSQQFAMFELVPSFSKRGAVDVKWFQAYPLRAGVGSRAMKELQSLAREDGIILTLFPWDKGQVSQAKLTKFYKGQGFKPVVKGSKNMAWDPDLDEGWKEKLGAAALGSALTLGGIGVKNAMDTPTTTVTEPAAQVQQVQRQASPVKAPHAKAPLTKEGYLQNIAKKVGMEGAELSQFMAQAAHETLNFSKMAEVGTPKYFAKKYDPKYNPRKAKILGNKKVGDGELFKGRGYLQLTGRDNYTRASKALYGDDRLVQNPDLVEKDQKIAAETAIWYWKNRVAPKIGDFSNTKAVTKKINPGMKGMKSRKNQYAQYAAIDPKTGK